MKNEKTRGLGRKIRKKTLLFLILTALFTLLILYLQTTR